VFNPLLEAALAGPDRARLDDLVRNPSPELAAMTRTRRVADMAQGVAQAGPPGRALDLWRVVTAELWLRHRFPRAN
jgi:hypothetical protein